MTRLLRLAENGWALHVTAVLAAGAAIELRLDPRYGLMLVGLVVALNGALQLRAARRAEVFRALQRGVAVFLIVFGAFMIAVPAIMLARGEHL